MIDSFISKGHVDEDPREGNREEFFGSLRKRKMKPRKPKKPEPKRQVPLTGTICVDSDSASASPSAEMTDDCEDEVEPKLGRLWAFEVNLIVRNS